MIAHVARFSQTGKGVTPALSTEVILGYSQPVPFDLRSLAQLRESLPHFAFERAIVDRVATFEGHSLFPGDKYVLQEV